MENEAIDVAVVEGASGPGGVAGAGGVRPAGAGEGGKAGEVALFEAGEPGGEGQVEGEAKWFRAFEARRVLAKRQGELEALGEDEIIVLRVDPQRVADVALGIARRDSAPERRVLFERAAENGLYDLRHLDNLHEYAQVVWHARREQGIAANGESNAALPEEEVAAAYATRGRMTRVLDYQLGDRPDMQELLASLRGGTRHLDLANDLHTLAVTYGRDDVRPFLEQDKKHYRASDADEAVRYAEMIRASRGLAEAGELERLVDVAQRAATLLLRAYREHRRVGQFLFGQRENVAATYPSLIGAVRAPRRKRAPGGGGGGQGPGDGPSAETPAGGL